MLQEETLNALRDNKRALISPDVVKPTLAVATICQSDSLVGARRPL
jgi:hypothetical protein